MNKINLPDMKRAFTGLWLLSLYFINVSLVVYSLSTYQFQTELNSIPQVTSNKETKFVSHECDVSGLNKEILTKTIVKVPCIPIGTSLETQYYSTGEILSIYKRMTDVVDNEIQLEYEKRAKLLSTLETINGKIKSEPTNELLVYEKSAAEGNIHQINLLIKQLNDQKSKFMLEHKDLVETFSDIRYFENFFKVFSSVFGIDSFWALPRQILTIILILSMGVLGSLIFITIEFLKSPDDTITENFSMYLFRPFLGMIVALAMYVMIKSGQSTFSNDEMGSLSPFLISFLGIISGMLAEQAYKKLVFTGSKMLNSETNNNSKEE